MGVFDISCKQARTDSAGGQHRKGDACWRRKRGGKISAGKVQVKHRLPLRFVRGVEQALGLGFVAGAQAGLIAGGGVLSIIHAVVAAE